MFGVLNINKPPGITSRDAVNTVQRLVKPAKAGHAGTLDPMATGVLLVCVGGATRLISLIQQSPKTYLAEFTLGQRSDTDDCTGTITNVAVDSVPGESEVRSALRTFTGTIDQIPPAFSAVKVAGRRAYDRARRGEDVVLAAKKVTVHSIDVVRFDWPVLVVKIECGSGTYIRSIARDLGEYLGCGGLMSALQRTQIGEFRVADGIQPDTLTADSLVQAMHNPVSIVSALPHYYCSCEDTAEIQRGRTIPICSSRLQTSNLSEPQKYTAMVSNDGGCLLALAEPTTDNRLQPRMVFPTS